MPLPRPGPGEVIVRTLRSAVSRGTEALVFGGRVPADQYDVMRAPFQDGDFPGPVKYGYLNVGVVEAGPPELVGRTVFCLHPHQSAYVVPASAVTVVPDDVPAERAVLTGIVETAVNALWDAAAAGGGPGGRRRRGHRGVLRRPAARPASPEPRSRSSTSTPVAPRWRRCSTSEFALPERRARRLRPGVPHERHLGRPPAVAASCSPRRARSSS